MLAQKIALQAKSLPARSHRDDDNRNGRGCMSRSFDGLRSDSCDDIDLAVDKIGRHFRDVLGPPQHTKFNVNVFSVDIAERLQPSINAALLGSFASSWSGRSTGNKRPTSGTAVDCPA